MDLKESDNRFSIGAVNISLVNMQTAVNAIEKQVDEKKSAYICVTNVRTSMLSQKDCEYCQIQNDSYLTVPDGKPLVWFAHLLGEKSCERVSGVDLMQEIFALSAEKGYSHYFYGSTEDVLEKMELQLTELYSGMALKGFCSPPFRELSDVEIDEFVNQINTIRPTFLWVGLGAPKQERFMKKVVSRLDGVILVGVGLAFEYIAGTVGRAPLWMQKDGLEWLYRCGQQPIKARRFIIPFFKFLWILFLQTIRQFAQIILAKAKVQK
ncbi:WecB/TagA/CpsF family glycosyltransferase [uncultured Desulfobacter sp.]|uniref:WecB/TagA/CpsF family glycosyltransferase n=1 Tax=uncultured Desulfobacter sp. TaxID=240139 RepID=UPI002AA67911|nr:WecB/TagA/CpsF family glycosyltransferase [uncultured Desulfobacter sp.]